MSGPRRARQHRDRRGAAWRTWARTLLAAALPGLLTACGAATAQTAGAASADDAAKDQTMPLDHNPKAALVAPQLINDRFIKEKLREAAVRLAAGKAGTPVDPALLLAGLKQPVARFVLPRVAAAPDAMSGIARARAATVVFGVAYKCDKCEKWHVNTASGFVIGDRGEVVTNHHVIAKERLGAVVAMTADGVMHHVVEVLAGDAHEDLAVLRLDDGGLANPGWQPLALGADAVMGTPVLIVSHPDERFYSLTEGRVSRTYLAKHKGTSIARVEITADFARGSSGAAVINHNGEVIGVVNNTHSIYYDKDKTPPHSLQMVLKRAVPVSSLKRLLTKP
jgi:S1-C subfamily serine protease